MAGRLTPRGTVYQKNALRSKSKNMLGQGQFSIYLPRRVDAEYYVRSPVKVKAEMLLSPEHLGGRSPGSIPCRARAEKLTRENGLSVVNVPIKIEAELLLTPGMAFSYKPATPQSPTPQDIHEGSLLDSRPLPVAESWELWGKKMKAALSKYRTAYGVKSEDLWQTKQVLVSELRLDNKSDKTRELTKRINSYASQVFEQNKRIRLLQARLREEEGDRAESSEKFCVVEQHCRLLEKKLKAAESRAMGAEHQAEAIKLRTKDLGVVCGHQGVQLKELARQVDFFAKILASEKVAALDTYKALEQQLVMQKVFENEPLSARTATSDCSGSTVTRTNMKSFNTHGPLVEMGPQPTPNRRAENQYALYPCSSSSRRSRDNGFAPRSEPRGNSECSELEATPKHSSHLVNQSMHFAPNWDVEFNSSMKRAEELIKQCAVQASRLKDLSAELDCVGTRNRRDRKAHPRLVCFESKTYEVQPDPAEPNPSPEKLSSSKPRPNSNISQGYFEDPHMSKPTVVADSMHISVEDFTSIQRTLTPEPMQCSVDNPILNKFKVITNPPLEPACRKELKDQSTQTLPLAAEYKMERDNKKELMKLSRHPCSSSSHGQKSRHAAFRKATMPLRFEIKIWRIAGQTLMQASMLWLGIRLLPQMQLFRFFPPAT
ncbi:hypothetical protein MPTK1_7g16480 [Marchantia polymorpha subsp. ruderalis]|uniref:Uncharacterized protein n=2 Tax=Marchantia polymorpha TaxID=3197 RepID=A0A176VHC7_MARPO|nr:hypothetical protein AXG93_4010s1070 [Marchantia polymorpha subsp. ruderalis]PTQ30543.1 hypothetical protein MARPO_0123s0030 [Marchantia polymorpha]BBN17720.1 hypothetical protein Mp_7g16480 [Marchantia polymorpha subsp. ruderalis]|eukprot:PTQ30543.1 hypothetical protein MARPO_0123s0030 [Marchantia polymorpha]